MTGPVTIRRRISVPARWIAWKRTGLRLTVALCRRVGRSSLERYAMAAFGLQTLLLVVLGTISMRS